MKFCNQYKQGIYDAKIKGYLSNFQLVLDQKSKIVEDNLSQILRLIKSVWNEKISLFMDQLDGLKSFDDEEFQKL